MFRFLILIYVCIAIAEAKSPFKLCEDFDIFPSRSGQITTPTTRDANQDRKIIEVVIDGSIVAAQTLIGFLMRAFSHSPQPVDQTH